MIHFGSTLRADKSLCTIDHGSSVTPLNACVAIKHKGDSCFQTTADSLVKMIQSKCQEAKFRAHQRLTCFAGQPFMNSRLSHLALLELLCLIPTSSADASLLCSDVALLLASASQLNKQSCTVSGWWVQLLAGPNKLCTAIEGDKIEEGLGQSQWHQQEGSTML